MAKPSSRRMTGRSFAQRSLESLSSPLAAVGVAVAAGVGGIAVVAPVTTRVRGVGVVATVAVAHGGATLAADLGPDRLDLLVLEPGGVHAHDATSSRRQ